MDKLELSLEESNSLKGIALILLLIHHLFYVNNNLYDDIYIKDIGIINAIGIVCKVCVAIFVFISGYGLGTALSKRKRLDVFAFYRRRFIKLFLNYWFIWLIFVPIGLLLFDRTFDTVYGNGGWSYAVLDVFGLLNLTGRFGYNPTWWFYSCIILLYILYPIIAITVLRWPKIIWFYIIIGILLIKVRLTFIGPIRYYLLPFILGIAASNNFLRSTLHSSITLRDLKIYNLLTRSGELGILILLFVTACVLRFSISEAFLWDTLIAILLILTYKSAKKHINFDVKLGFIVKHSFNIFLFHTFIYYLYFPMLIYWSRNPIIIFMSLFILCIVISIGLEKIKIGIGFYKFQSILLGQTDN